MKTQKEIIKKILPTPVEKALAQQREEYIKDLEGLLKEKEEWICEECLGGTCSTCFSDYKKNHTNKIQILIKKYENLS
ncbi:MAG TPA: hypothetical protein ENH85_02895 [Candidatus Scalindua sp.]|nr:hypothetical protein [Candidatus Scalindua sp.]